MMLAPRRGSSVSVPLTNHVWRSGSHLSSSSTSYEGIVIVYKISACETCDALAILERITNIFLFGAQAPVQVIFASAAEIPVKTSELGEAYIAWWRDLALLGATLYASPERQVTAVHDTLQLSGISELGACP